jgi:hypothetical protein
MRAGSYTTAREYFGLHIHKAVGYIKPMTLYHKDPEALEIIGRGL